jgi:hypothetical protein
MKRLILFAALVAGCNNNVVQTPIRVFDRPSDVALTCVQIDPVYATIYRVHPLADCDPAKATDLQLTAIDPTTGTTLIDPTTGLPSEFPPVLRAVVANSARGEVALVDVSLGQIVDLDARNPGFNFIPVGKLPEHIRVSANGCQAVTSNTDSCDLSIIDLARLHNAPRSEIEDLGAPLPPLDGGASYTDQMTRRLTPTVNGRPLGARPSWIEYAPDSVDGTPQSAYCTDGQQTAWVAFPGCQLVAEVSISSRGSRDANAEVLQAIRITRDSATVLSPAEITALSCPSECSGEIPSGGTPANTGPADGGTFPDGGSSLPNTQGMPGTLAIDGEKTAPRMFIGDLANEKLWIVPVAPGTPELGTPRSLQLEHGANGVSVVRVSPRSQAGKFLYAVARDGTVRVVDLDREVECETNPDPRAVLADGTALLSIPRANGDPNGDPIDPGTQARQLGCFPLGAPGTPPRNPSVLSPGLTLQGNALAKDVSFVHVEVPPPPVDINGNYDPTIAPPNAGPNLVMGDYAWVIGSDGRATLVNVFDACPAPNLQSQPSGPFTPSCALINSDYSMRYAQGFAGRPTASFFDRISHRLRQGANKLGAAPVNCTDNGGAPRISDESPGNNFSVTVNGTAAGAATDGGVNSLPSLFQAQNLPLDPVASPQCASSTAASIAVYDPDHVRNESWDLVWEGVVPGTTRSTITIGQASGNGANVFVDPGGEWCTRGVKAGDKLVLTGCNTDNDCDFAQTCYRDPAAPPDVANGLCLNRVGFGPDGGTATNTNPVDPGLQTECSILLRSIKRYRIQHAYQGRPLPVSGEQSDWLQVSEIYEPEHLEQTHECDPTQKMMDPCADVQLTGPKDMNGNPTTLTTRCLPDSDGKNRCLRWCMPGDANLANSGCGTDYLCIGADHSSIPSTETGRCMRAPISAQLFADCLNELQPYEIHAGEAFLVNGSATGHLQDFEPDPTTRECVVPPVSSPYVRLHQGRIPLGGPDLQWCPPPSDPRHLHDPRVGPDYNQLGALDSTLPNVCLDAGPTPMLSACTPGVLVSGCPMGQDCLARSESPANGFCADRSVGRSVHFENIFYAIELVVPARQVRGGELANGADLVPGDGTDLKFSIVGGGFPLAATLGVDATAQQPRVIVTSPDSQTVFVVDEGKQSAATGLRGQLLRVSTSVQATDRSFQVR